jgi:hypothetical protein
MNRSNMKRFMSKKLLVVGVAMALVLGIGGAAFAYFTAHGSGTGSATTGSAANLTISQVGPGYDSLASTYHQDQCFECTSITEFGNEINLAAGSGQLSNVVVAFRSYAGGTSSEPITLTLYNPGVSPGSVGSAIPYASVTTDPTIPPGDGHTVFYATFDFSHIDLTISGPVVYSISFTDEPGVTINVALSNSVSNLTVGSDVYPGYVFVDGATNALSASSDAGSCATSTASVFMATDINCATPGGNYGAYGPGSNPANADIPAVEFNVVGGSPVLYPGSSAPVDLAITNPGASSAYVGTVTAVISSVTSGSVTPAESACSTGEYSLSPATDVINDYVAPGTTFFVPSGITITMINESYPQDNCQGSAGGGVLTLGFSS